MWLARARKDGRALDRESERQEAQAAAGKRPEMASHGHHHHAGHNHSEVTKGGHDQHSAGSGT